MKGPVTAAATLNAGAEEKGSEIEKSLRTIQAQARKNAAEIVRETLQPGTKIMSFKFACSDGRKYPDYKAGQHAMKDLEKRKKENLEESVRSFTVASSHAEKDAMMSSTRVRDII